MLGTVKQPRRRRGADMDFQIRRGISEGLNDEVRTHGVAITVSGDVIKNCAQGCFRYMKLAFRAVGHGSLGRPGDQEM